MARFRGYGQFCPVAMASEVISERWTLLLLRELLYGHTRFNELKRGVPLMSPSLLSQRLKQLEASNIVVRKKPEKGPGWEYRLTESGKQLGPIVIAISSWGLRWLQHDMPKQNLDAALLMWDMRRSIRADGAPKGRRSVVEFLLPEQPAAKRRWWVVFDLGEVDICIKDPGYEIDLRVQTDLRTLTDLWMGQIGIDPALRSEKLKLDGSREQRAAFREWFALAVVVRLPQWPWPEIAQRFAA